MIEAASYHVHEHDEVEDTPRNDRTWRSAWMPKCIIPDDVHKPRDRNRRPVYFDARPEVNNGFVRSRYLDDKACLACVFAAAKALYRVGTPLAQRTTFHIPNYEEVCHGGASGVPEDVAEFLAVDVAPVGSAAKLR